MRRFLCPDIPPIGQEVTLDEATSHHVLRVTGIAPGEAVQLFDGAGTAVVATLCGVTQGRAVLEVTSQAAAPAASRPVWLLPALVRPAAMETIVRMATEVGVVRITPLLSARVVARGDKSARWQRIAESSASQCGRADVPMIDAPRTLADALAALEGWSVCMCSPGAASQALPDGPVALLVGPEGGWTDEECAQVTESGASALGLGETTLRADTAAIVALSRLMA